MTSATPFLASRRNPDRSTTLVYLGDSGIASLAAAVFMIRDGDISGSNITLLEERDRHGGALDGCGSPRTGYVLRGGRMLGSKYLCTLQGNLRSACPLQGVHGPLCC